MKQEQPSYLNQILHSFDFPQWLKEASRGQLLHSFVVIAVLALGGTGAYLLGVLFAVPWPIARLFNEETLLHIAGDFTFILVVGWSFFKINRLAVTGLYSSWIFLICKFAIGPKYERGIRNPIVARYQRFRFWRFLQNSKKIIIVGQLVIPPFLMGPACRTMRPFSVS